LKIVRVSWNFSGNCVFFGEPSRKFEILLKILLKKPQLLYYPKTLKTFSRWNFRSTKPQKFYFGELYETYGIYLLDFFLELDFFVKLDFVFKKITFFFSRKKPQYSNLVKQSYFSWNYIYFWSSFLWIFG